MALLSAALWAATKEPLSVDDSAEMSAGSKACEMVDPKAACSAASLELQSVDSTAAHLVEQKVVYLVGCLADLKVIATADSLEPLQAALLDGCLVVRSVDD